MIPLVDPRRASTTGSPRCRSRGPLERRVPAVPPYPIPTPCPARPTTLARRCSPGLGVPLVECAVGWPAASRRQTRSCWVTCWTCDSERLEPAAAALAPRRRLKVSILSDGGTRCADAKRCGKKFPASYLHQQSLWSRDVRLRVHLTGQTHR